VQVSLAFCQGPGCTTFIRVWDMVAGFVFTVEIVAGFHIGLQLTYNLQVRQNMPPPPKALARAGPCTQLSISNRTLICTAPVRV
jgi:hypothetical protein